MVAGSGGAKSGVSLCPEGPRVWIVVLNWNGLGDTRECLDSLGRLRYPNARILVVDNGSRNHEAERIREAFSHVTVLPLPENRGYAGGNNAGIRLALRNGADYVWLLNNDATVEPGCLAALVSAGERHPRIGLLSPMIYDYAPPRGVQFCGAFLDHRTQSQLIPTSLEDSRIAEEAGPLLLWGTALLLKRALVDVIGVLDERYFAYQEDLDYSLRASAAGFDASMVPEAAVFHKSGRSLGPKESPLREYLMVRNWYLLWHSHLTGWRRHTHWRGFLVWALDRALEAREAGRPAVAAHVLDGIWDASRGHWGSAETKGEMPRALRRLILDGFFAWHPYAWMTLFAEGPLGVLRYRSRRGRRRPEAEGSSGGRSGR